MQSPLINSKQFCHLITLANYKPGLSLDGMLPCHRRTKTCLLNYFHSNQSKKYKSAIITVILHFSTVAGQNIYSKKAVVDRFYGSSITVYSFCKFSFVNAFEYKSFFHVCLFYCECVCVFFFLVYLMPHLPFLKKSVNDKRINNETMQIYTMLPKSTSLKKNPRTKTLFTSVSLLK